MRPYLATAIVGVIAFAMLAVWLRNDDVHSPVLMATTIAMWSAFGYGVGRDYNARGQR